LEIAAAACPAAFQNRDVAAGDARIAPAGRVVARGIAQTGYDSQRLKQKTTIRIY
jgi:hypothetical protein